MENDKKEIVTKRIFQAKKENLDAVIGFIEDELRLAGYDEKIFVKMSIASEELFVNVCNYGYPDSQGDVEVSVLRSNDSFNVTFSDTGVPFNPLEHEDIDIHSSIVERPIGGLGIIMVKKWADEVLYRYEDGKNKVTISKRM